MNWTHLKLLCSFIPFLMISCTPISSEPNHVICRELKSKMILNNATRNIGRSETQRAELQLQQHDYDQRQCDNLS